MPEEFTKTGTKKPHIVVLGSNFGGLTAARFIHKSVGNAADITVIDRKPYLLFVPHIPLTILEDGDPAMKLHLAFLPFYKEDKTTFIQAEVKSLDPESTFVEIVPS